MASLLGPSLQWRAHSCHLALHDLTSFFQRRSFPSRIHRTSGTPRDCAHVLLDVVLHVILQFRGQSTQAQVAFPVVQMTMSARERFLGGARRSTRHLVVGRAGGDKQPDAS